jgi:hypothetical protein
VCPRACGLFGPAPSDTQNISTRSRVRSHPLFRGRGHRESPWQPPYVSAATGSRINLVPMKAVSPGAGRGPQSGAGHWSSAASTILGRTRYIRSASTPVDGADRGNQPIHRRVDTISKQYQVSSRTRDASHDGGGAPWES